jgi:hypothetical protein
VLEAISGSLLGVHVKAATNQISNSSLSLNFDQRVTPHDSAKLNDLGQVRYLRVKTNLTK